MIRRYQKTILILLLAVSTFGCKDAGKGNVTVHEAPVIEEPTAAEKEAQAKAETPDETNAAKTTPWATNVAATAKKLATVVTQCNEKYLKKLKPDELLVGMPALVTKDGVVTVLERDCSYLSDGYEAASQLMENKHPLTDDLLRDWSLLADLYGRFALTSINIGHKAKRRKLNAEEMKAELPNLTATLIPRLVKNAKLLAAWNSDVVPGYPSSAIKKDEATSVLRAQFSNTAKQLRALEDAWMTYAHNPLAKELYVRRRHMNWLHGHWRTRLAREKKKALSAIADTADNTKKLRATGAAFYLAADAWFTNAWTAGTEAYADRSLIDEPKLKAAKKAFKTEGKAFSKAMKKLKI